MAWGGGGDAVESRRTDDEIEPWLEEVMSGGDAQAQPRVPGGESDRARGERLRVKVREFFGQNKCRGLWLPCLSLKLQILLANYVFHLKCLVDLLRGIT
jgi:hypothetical protein